MIKAILQKRKQDGYGSGEFNASRGNRKHRGIDYACWPQSLICSSVDGVVTKHGYPYADDLSYRYIEITSEDQARHRFFYVSPMIDIGEMVKTGDIIGEGQDITRRYHEREMTPHIHYEILIDGLPVDPENYHK